MGSKGKRQSDEEQGMLPSAPKPGGHCSFSHPGVCDHTLLGSHTFTHGGICRALFSPWLTTASMGQGYGTPHLCTTAKAGRLSEVVERGLQEPHCFRVWAKTWRPLMQTRRKVFTAHTTE